MLRTLGALGMVLGMLAGALWVVRRYDLKLPGRVSGGGRKRVEMVERLAIDAKRSVALIRRDGCEHLILIGPEGHATIETGIAAPEPVAAPVAEAAAPKIAADLQSVTSAFGKLLDLPKRLPAASNDDGDQDDDGDEPDDAPEGDDASEATGPIADLPRATPRKRAPRRPRDTARWNRRAVREALNA